MRSTFKSIVVAALLAHAGAAFAQDDAEAPETETEATQEQEEQSSDLDLGEPAGPAVGQAYILQEFGDWAMRCIRAPEGEADPCNMYQLLSDDQGNAIAEFNFFRLPEGSTAVAGATVVVPLETLLTEQLTLSVDGQNARRYPFRFCNQGGCIARLGFTQAEIDQFKRGAEGTVRLVHAANPSNEILLKLSLTGFTAGFEGSVSPAE